MLPKRYLVLMGALLAALSMGVSAFAQAPCTQQTFTSSVPLQTTDFLKSVSIPQFDPALGVLQSVTIQLDGSIVSDIQFESLDSAASTCTSSLNGTIELRRPDNTVLAAVLPATQQVEPVGAFDGIIDFGGASGRTYPAVTASQAQTITVPPPGADLALFVGPGSIVLPVRATSKVLVTGPGNVAQLVRTKASANVTVSYCYVPYAALGDKVWHDKNANGIQDADEPGIDGVVVNLLDCNGQPTGKTTTTANGGLYLFDKLEPGCYIVEFVAPADYVVSPQDQGADDAADSDIDAVTGRTVQITLDPGETDLTWDAGLYKLASIGDLVWLDTDRDGIQDEGEIGVEGVEVRLYKCSDSSLVGTTTTEIDGTYKFDQLMPGDYYVQFIAPEGYNVSSPNQGSDDAVDSDAETDGKTACTTLESGEYDPTWDAGIYPLAALGDKVWLDDNKNGVQDPGEQGVDGVTVNLLDCSGQPTGESTVTANGGLYLFDNLVPGCYIVEFVPPAGFVVSPKDQGSNDAADSDADATTGRTVQILLDPNETDLTWDAGIYKPSEECDASTCITVKFYNAPISYCGKLWLSAVMKLSNPGTEPTNVIFENGTVGFKWNGVNYNVAAPRGVVSFQTGVTSASTTYDAVSKTWYTTVPVNYSGWVFVTGVVVTPGTLTGQLSGQCYSTTPVTWCFEVTADRDVSVSWKWAAAVYSRLPTDYNLLKVKPVDGYNPNPYKNSDKAATPEAYKSYLMSGACGNGGANYTGTFSYAKTKVPCLVETPEPPCDPSSCITVKFYDTPLAVCNTVWFNAVVKLNNRSGQPATLFYDEGNISFKAGGKQYNIAVPAAMVSFEAGVTKASSIYDSVKKMWITKVPLSYNGNVFLTGVGVTLSYYGQITALCYDVTPVTWCGDFYSDDAIQAEWKWAAAVYRKWPTSDRNLLKVKPIDGSALNSYANSDKAGTPEGYKFYVTGGACGTGGSNYTGTFSTPVIKDPCPIP